MSFLKSSEAEPVAEAPSGKSREVGIWNWVRPRPGTCGGAMTWTLAQSPRGSDQWKRFGTSGVWLQIKIYCKVRLRQSYRDLCPVPPPSPCATSVCPHFLQLPCHCAPLSVVLEHPRRIPDSGFWHCHSLCLKCSFPDICMLIPLFTRAFTSKSPSQSGLPWLQSYNAHSYPPFSRLHLFP